MIIRCASTVISRFAKRPYFLRSYENREHLAKLKTDFNKNLALSDFLNISLDATNFRRTTSPHETSPLRLFSSVSLVSFHGK